MCLWCGQPFIGTRRAVYCSSRCRQAMHRTPAEERPKRELSAKRRFGILKRDGFRCHYCGRSVQQGATLHVDHITALARGGGNEDGNLVTACQDCNLGKGMS